MEQSQQTTTQQTDTTDTPTGANTTPDTQTKESDIPKTAAEKGTEEQKQAEQQTDVEQKEDTLLGSDTKKDTESLDKEDESGDNEEKDEDSDKSKDLENFKLEVPEGVELDEGREKALLSLVKEGKLDPEGAQQLLDSQLAFEKEQNDNFTEQLKALREGWLEEAKYDKEYGGENFEKNTGLAVKVIERFGGEGIKEILNESGLGNHPEIIRTFVRIGQAMKDGDMNTGGQNSSPKLTKEEILYPTMRRSS